MATLLPSYLGTAKLLPGSYGGGDQYGGNPSSVIFGQPLVSHLAPDGRWQYAAWYAPNNALTLARRLVEAHEWDVITLPFGLNANDSHNCIALGISTADGRLHVAAGQHNDPVQYTASYAGFLDDGSQADWDASVFEPVGATLLGTAVGELTYPTFTTTPDGWLQFWYRNGGSGNGVMRLAEYVDGAWTLIGDVTSPDGAWTSNGATSLHRNLYWAHPVYGPGGWLHLAGVWREENTAVLCSPGMFTNHNVVYLRSPDDGRTWQTGAGDPAGETGSAPVHVGVSGIHLPSFGNCNLAPQVSDLALGPDDQVVILPDYVDPAELTGSPKCVTSMDQRFQKAGEGPRWRYGSQEWEAVMVKVNGATVRTGYPTGRKAATRGRVAIGPGGEMVIVFSGMRILSAPPPYTTWTVDEDGANTAYAFGEVGGVDRARESEGLLSVLYIQRDGRVRVRDIKLA